MRIPDQDLNLNLSQPAHPMVGRHQELPILVLRKEMVREGKIGFWMVNLLL